MNYADPPGRWSSNRLFEWTMAIAMTALGLHLIVFPFALITSRFEPLLLLLPGQVIIGCCIVIGAIRIGALITNGRMGYTGSLIRACAAVLSAITWLEMSIALYIAHSSSPSPGVTLYVILAFGEIVSVWRARRDANGF